MRAVTAIALAAVLIMGSTSGAAWAAGGEKPVGVFDGYYGRDGKYHRDADLVPLNDNWRCRPSSGNYGRPYGSSRPYNARNRW